jgi:hypothetical protein
MLQICGALNRRICSKGPAMTRFPTLLGAAFLALPAAAHAAACGPANSIVSVRNSSIGAFEYVSPPFIEDPSGNTIIVAGSKFTEVRFDSVYWFCTIAQNFHLPKTAIKGIKRTGQFEGVISYVIGRRASSHYISNYSFDSGPGYRSIVIKFKK